MVRSFSFVVFAFLFFAPLFAVAHSHLMNKRVFYQSLCAPLLLFIAKLRWKIKEKERKEARTKKHILSGMHNTNDT